MSGRIITVTLNAAIDRRLQVDTLATPGVTRAVSVECSAGGKGLNVARVAHHIGADVTATGFLAGHAGAFIADQLDALSVPHDFVWVEGESRICLNILDARGGSTEVLEPGVSVGPDQVAALEDKLVALAGPDAAVVFSGSLPPGCGSSTYARLVEAVKQTGALTVVDTSGAALRDVLAAHPDVIKPNTDELAQLTGQQVDDPASAARIAHRLGKERGLDTVIVSLGGTGAVLAHAGQLCWVEPPRLTAVNTVGCGDALVAAFTASRVKGETAQVALARAVEVASAAALSSSTGWVEADDLARVRALRVQLHHLSVSSTDADLTRGDAPC